MKLRAVRLAAATAILPIVLSGCDLLLAGLYPPEPFTDPFVEPGSAVFASGKATLEITGGDVDETVVLDRANGSLMYGMATVTWRNDDGWSMSITSYGTTGGFHGAPGFGGDVMIQRIHDNQLWTTGFEQSYNQCTLSVSESTMEHVAGSAECVQMRWIDGFAAPPGFGQSQPYIEGEPRFNVNVTFEAKAGGATQNS